MLFESKGGSLLSPLSSAEISFVSGNVAYPSSSLAVASTDSNGFFIAEVTPDTNAIISVSAANFNDASVSMDISSAASVYLLLQQTDSQTYELLATTSAKPVVTGNDNLYAALDTTLYSSDKTHKITASSWTLGTSINVNITPYNNPNTPTAVKAEVKGISGKVIAGADLQLKKKSDGKSVDPDEINFTGHITPYAYKVIGDVAANTINDMVSQGLTSLSLWYYADDPGKSGKDYTWQKAGSATITYDANNGKITLAPASGVYITNFYDFVFVMSDTVMPKITVSGKVTDKITGDPISNVMVMCNDAFAVTNSTGAYLLSITLPVNTSKLTVSATANGYRDETVYVSVTGMDKSVTAHIQLEPIVVSTKAIITGTVTDQGTGLPIAGATVKLRSPSVLANINTTNFTGTTGIIAGLEGTANYKWEIQKKSESSWITIKQDSGTNGANMLLYTEIIGKIQDLITLGATYYTGTYNLKVIATHTSGLIEIAEGEFDVIMDDSAIEVSPDLGGFDIVSIWGGDEKGFYFASVPTSDPGTTTTLTWTAKLEGTFNGNYALIAGGTLSNATLLYTTSVKKFIADNFAAMMEKFDSNSDSAINASDISYIEDGITLTITVTADYTLGGNAQQGSSETIRTIKGTPSMILTVANMVITANKQVFSEMTVVTGTNGTYEFKDIAPEMSNLLDLQEGKDGYVSSDFTAVGALTAGSTITKNVSLKPFVAPNSAPTLSVTSDVTSGEAPLTVTFTATAADSDGTIASYAWVFGDGQTATSQNPVHVFTNPGNYSVAATATDDDGSSAVSTVSITAIYSTNAAPDVMASADIYSGVVPLTVNFTATANDSDGTIASYSWNFGDSATSTTQNPSHSFTTAGNYIASLTVTDDNSATSMSSVSIMVTDTVLTAPAVDAGSDITSGKAPLAVMFTVTGTDTDGTIASYAWEFGDGEMSAQQNPSHTYTQAGNYTAKVTVSDNDGLKSNDTVSIIANANVPPSVTASADKTTGKAPLAVSFSATGADNDGTIAGYSWNFGDNASSTLQNPSHTYQNAGTYVASVIVTDSNGATANTSVTITATTNAAPTVSITATPSTGNKPLNVQFNATAADSDGYIASYAWTFGDGGTSNIQNPSYIYSTAGSFTVSLVVTDDGGTTASASTSITTVNPQGLVAWWKFDENDGTSTADSSGNGNTGTVNGATFTTGINDNALSFDGSNDYVQVGTADLLGGLKNCTIELWTVIDQMTGESPDEVKNNLISKSPHSINNVNQFEIAVERTASGVNRIYTLVYYEGTTQTNAVYSQIFCNLDTILGGGIFGQWHHVVVTISETAGVVMYLDGVAIGSNATNAEKAVVFSNTEFVIGIRPNREFSSWWRAHDGKIDEVKIYNYARSAEEILTDFNNTFEWVNEDFSQSLSNWKLWGSPSPEIDSTSGNNSPSFNPNGDGSYDSGAITLESFDFSAGEVSISADMLVPGGWSEGWTFTGLAITTDAPASYGSASGMADTGCLAYIQLNDNSNPNSFYRVSGLTPSEGYSPSWSDPLEAVWHNFKIRITADLKVEFYRDNIFRYATANSLSAGQLSAVYVVIAGRDAFSNVRIDNVLIEKQIVPDITWTKTYHEGSDEMLSELCVDGNGNIYAIVMRWDSYGAGTRTWRIMKYDANGILLNNVNIGASSDANGGASIKTDASGNIYVGVTISNGDIRASKYDASFALQWEKTYNYGTPDLVEKNGLVLDSANNPIIAGAILGNLWDHWMRKYDGTNGNTTWTSTWSESGNTLWQGACIDSSNNIFAIGNRWNGSNHDILIKKYDLNGSEQWYLQYNSGYNDGGLGGIAVDSSGNFYVSSTIGTASQGADAWIRKYDASKNILWTKTWNGSANSTDYAFDIAVDTDGYVYVAGYENVTGQSSNIWVSKYDSSGNPIWTRTYNGNANAADAGYAIWVDANYVYVGGYENTSGEGKNMFIRKYTK